MPSQNLAVVFAKPPTSFPVVGEHLKVENVGFDADAALPADSIQVEVLYVSLDPYMRGRMRPAEQKSYFPAFDLNTPLANAGIGRVLKSSSDEYKEGDIVYSMLPFQQYTVIELGSKGLMQGVRKIDVQNGPQDLRHWLGALGMPGLTAYSSLYAIGKPKKGETIFISSAAGAVGQLVGQLAKHEGLTVIGSVGSDDKLKHLVDDLGFDGGFNYKKESAGEALKRLAPEGIDIYYENVGGEQLEAAIDSMKMRGRIIACGMISQYNVPKEEAYGVRNLLSVVGKRITMRGFIVSDEDMGPLYAKEHQEKVGAWLKDGSFKATLHEWVGIDNGANALIGMLKGENFGKAILKVKA